jgi:hypothetical protein
MSQPTLRTISVIRRGYGRRYTDLPIDELSQQRIMIDCSGGYLKPTMIDLQPDDMVYWREQGRYVTARIELVQRDERAFDRLAARCKGDAGRLFSVLSSLLCVCRSCTMPAVSIGTAQRTEIYVGD